MKLADYDKSAEEERIDLISRVFNVDFVYSLNIKYEEPVNISAYFNLFISKTIKVKN